MGMFTKADRTPSESGRRIDDTPLDGAAGRTLPIIHRVFIKVLVSELRKMLDERDVEREQREHQARERMVADQLRGTVGYVPGADPSAQRAEMDGTSSLTGVDKGGRFTPPAYRDRTEQDG